VNKACGFQLRWKPFRVVDMPMEATGKFTSKQPNKVLEGVVCWERAVVAVDVWMNIPEFDPTARGEMAVDAGPLGRRRRLKGRLARDSSLEG
jgi:hypothetical protein